ncbi:MAG: cyclic nucleotide-binding domain-containing protein [Rhodospirillales bacterium]
MDSSFRQPGAIDGRRLIAPAVAAGVLLLAWHFYDDWVDLAVAEFPNRIVALSLVRRAVIAASWLVAAGIFVRVVNVLFWNGLVERRRGYRVPHLLNDVFAAVVFLIAGIFILVVAFGVSELGVVGILTVAVLIVGVFLRKTIEDVFAGIATSFDRPFEIGDTIEVAGASGRVEEINWRTIRLLSPGQGMIVVPNGVIAAAVIRNLSRPTAARKAGFEVVLAYGVPPERGERILAGAALATPGVLADPAPEILPRALSRDGLVFGVDFWVSDTAEADRVRGRVVANVVRYLAVAGIDAPGAPGPAAVAGTRPTTGGGRDLDLDVVIRRVDLFAVLTADERKALVQDARQQVVPAGAELCRQGETGESLFVLVEGVLDVLMTDDSGVRRKVARVVPGECIGEMSLLTGAPRAATVAAVTEAVVVEFGHANIAAILHSRPELSNALAAIMARRQAANEAASAVAAGEEKVSSLTQLIAERIARFFGIGRQARAQG